ncbi:hypothetical protein A6R68_13512, partial [Neotoma lepida]
ISVSCGKKMNKSMVTIKDDRRRGATAGTIETKGNISAEEGGSVILQCHFFSNTAEVTQVNWEQRDQLLAVYSAEQGWHVCSVFRERVVPGPSLGLTFQTLTMNDTGEYSCTYHTYPDGIYKGRIFLKVQQSSAAQCWIPLLGGAMAAVLGLICLVITGVTLLARKGISCLLLGYTFLFPLLQLPHWSQQSQPDMMPGAVALAAVQ